MPKLTGSDRENIILIFYVSIFAIANIILYFLRPESGFIAGTVEIIVVFMYPFAAFIYGHFTADSTRSFLAGTCSYASFIVVNIIATGLPDIANEPGYLPLYIGYHLTNLILIGFIGFLASKRQRFLDLFSIILVVLWFVVLFSGIS